LKLFEGVVKRCPAQMCLQIGGRQQSLLNAGSSGLKVGSWDKTKRGKGFWDTDMNRRTFVGLAGAAALTPALGFTSNLQKQIKITGLETDVLRFPPGKIYYDAIHEFGAASGGVVLRLQTNAGITGWAESSFGTLSGAPEVLASILQNEVKPVLLGQDPAFPKRLRSDLWKALEYAGGYI
jgi:Mandelate racemase / muconate lactonizing enzyme, N-terminal domain